MSVSLRRFTRCAVLAFPIVLAGCGSSAPSAAPAGPVGAVDQERLMREATKKMGRPGEGITKTGPVAH